MIRRYPNQNVCFKNNQYIAAFWRMPLIQYQVINLIKNWNLNQNANILSQENMFEIYSVIMFLQGPHLQLWVILIICMIKCGIKLLVRSQTSTAAMLKFENDK